MLFAYLLLVDPERNGAPSLSASIVGRGGGGAGAGEPQRPQ